jgi:hypothetical protein
MISNRNNIIIASILVLILSGCALIIKSKWQFLNLEKHHISVEMPGKARHFNMNSQTTSSSLSYDEWLVNDDETNSQYFLILQKIKPEKYKSKPQSWLLTNIPHPNVGFMVKAKELSTNREYPGKLIYDEQVWKIDKRQEAVTRTYAVKGMIVQLIHLYQIKAPAELERIRFMDSIIFESNINKME